MRLRFFEFGQRRRGAARQNRSPSSWLLDYDLTPAGGTGVFDVSPVFGQSVVPTGEGGKGEVVLQFDWAVETSLASSGWARPLAMRCLRCWLILSLSIHRD